MKSSRVDPGLALLTLAAFLVPLVGGQVAVETVPFSGGPWDFVNGLFGSPELPIVSHLLLGILVLSAFIWLLLSRRVVQTPNNLVSAAAAIFFSIMVLTTPFSSFRTMSISVTTEWLVYGFALFAVVGLAGRRMGPTAIVTALFAGCVVAALKGIQEYGVEKAIDPTWRIFGGWNNPNALAAILLVGFFLGVGLTLTQDRVRSLVAGLCTVFIGFALLLTGSKGGVLSLIAVGAAWAIVSSYLGTRSLTSIGRVAAIVAGVIVFGAIPQLQQHAASTPSANAGAGGAAMGGRLLSGDSADQSAGFRRLLWQTSLDLIKTDPAGYGMGTFRFESGRPGLTTQTVFGHSTFLQLAVEGSVVLPVSLGLLLVLWFRLAFRGIRTLPAATRTTLFSVIAAVSAVLAHGLIDSDLYYFGAGLAMFLLLGVGLLLSADSVAPEYMFPSIRAFGACFAAIVLASFGYFAFVELRLASARADIDAGDRAAAAGVLAGLHTVAPSEGEVWYLSAMAATSPADKLTDAQAAVDVAPSTRNLRLLARIQKDQEQTAEAATTYNRALVLDPNNLTTLYQLAELQRQIGAADEYSKTLRRLIAVEDTSYFKVRSLPDLVPTETYQARIELADETNDPAEKRRLLTEAVSGFRDYLAKTVQNVIRMSKSTPPIDWGGITVDQAKEKMELAAKAAQTLASLDESAGDTAGAAVAKQDEAAFEGVKW